MTAVHQIRRIGTVIAAAAAAITFMASSAASAAPASRAAAARETAAAARTSPGAAASTRRPAGAHGSGPTVQTLVSSVQIFAAPSMASKVAGKMATIGTSVTVSCWTTGVSYVGDPIWYSITAPQAGFVPAYDMAAHFAPAPGLSHCSTPAFGRVYHALVLDLKIRDKPTFASTVLATLGPIGTAAVVSCWTTGSTVLSDSTWYYESSPATGYVSGRYLNTGIDPAPGVPRC